MRRGWWIGWMSLSSFLISCGKSTSHAEKSAGSGQFIMRMEDSTRALNSVEVSKEILTLAGDGRLLQLMGRQGVLIREAGDSFEVSGKEKALLPFPGTPPAGKMVTATGKQWWNIDGKKVSLFVGSTRKVELEGKEDLQPLRVLFVSSDTVVLGSASMLHWFRHVDGVISNYSAPFKKIGIALEDIKSASLNKSTLFLASARKLTSIRNDDKSMEVRHRALSVSDESPIRSLLIYMQGEDSGLPDVVVVTDKGVFASFEAGGIFERATRATGATQPAQASVTPNPNPDAKSADDTWDAVVKKPFEDYCAVCHGGAIMPKLDTEALWLKFKPQIISHLTRTDFGAMPPPSTPQGKSMTAEAKKALVDWLGRQSGVAKTPSMSATMTPSMPTTPPADMVELTRSSIGDEGAASTYVLNGLTHLLKGSGGDIWGSADAFLFASTDRSGPLTLTARVDSLAATNDYAKAGVMLRASDSPGSPNVFVGFMRVGEIQFQYRLAEGGVTQHQIFALNGETLPLFLRVQKQGATVSGSYSKNGTDWLPAGNLQNSIDYAKAGLAHTSHVKGTLGEAAFSEVTLTTAP